MQRQTRLPGLEATYATVQRRRRQRFAFVAAAVAMLLVLVPVFVLRAAQGDPPDIGPSPVVTVSPTASPTASPAPTPPGPPAMTVPEPIADLLVALGSKSRPSAPTSAPAGLCSSRPELRGSQPTRTGSPSSWTCGSWPSAT